MIDFSVFTYRLVDPIKEIRLRIIRQTIRYYVSYYYEHSNPLKKMDAIKGLFVIYAESKDVVVKKKLKIENVGKLPDVYNFLQLFWILIPIFIGIGWWWAKDLGVIVFM
ncbi:MAG: hypothetical protein GXO59_04440, partial [Dictyoglomi bacterium]|nr:hypothetical protein [Dictyoglomota bacterium]